MNVQFSRDIGEANSQFVMVFNESASKVKETFRTNQIEALDRLKAQRLDNFNRHYADQYLANIVMSLMKTTSAAEDEEEEEEEDDVDELVSPAHGPDSPLLRNNSISDASESSALMRNILKVEKRELSQIWGKKTEAVEDEDPAENEKRELKGSINSLAKASVISLEIGENKHNSQQLQS